MKNNRIQEARQILIALDLPRPQQNERSALCLLALLNLPEKKILEEGRKSFDWYYTDNELDKRKLWKKICSKHTRNSSAPNHAPIY